MGIIYVLTVVALFILHMLLYKKKQKQSVVKWIAISTILLLCYNIFVCLIMYLLKIQSTLINLSIINIISSIGLAIKIYKDRKIQKYKIDVVDIVQVLLTIIIAVIVLINQYGIPLNIKNKTTDANVHYFAAHDFYHYSTLLLEENSDELNLWNLGFLMPGAYINTGIVFKVFSGIVNESNFYQLYYIFDICIWSLSGILMYSLLAKNENKKHKIIALIFSIVYMLGYPLNSLLSGFSYLSIGLNIIITILIIMKEKINKYYKYLLMFLLNLGIFFSYYFFVPVVYLAEFIQTIIDIKKENKQIVTKENILKILYTFVIPSICGILYFIVFQMLKYKVEPSYGDVINIPGFIYTNFITNNLIFIALSIYYIKYCLENKKYNFKNIMLILHIFFMAILFIGMKLDKVSEYYYYKTYYLLWLLVISVSFYGIKQILLQRNKKQCLVYICIGIYAIVMVHAIKTQQSLFIFDIFKDNSKEIQKTSIIVTNEEIKLLEYYNENINTQEQRLENNVYICMTLEDNGKSKWLYVLTRNEYNYMNMTYADKLTVDIQQFIESDKTYFLLFKRDFKGDYNNIKQSIELNNLQILFENEAGMILQK